MWHGICVAAPMSSPTLGLRANAAPFALLVLVNAFVGVTVGVERSMLPSLAEQVFHLETASAVLSFLVAFGLSKAIANMIAGEAADLWGRKPVLVAGWLLALPVPWLLIAAPSWNWVVTANVLLGVSQGLTWSTAVVMKIDLVGSSQRGLAMGLNESAGYAAVAAAAAATGWLAATYGIRPAPFYLAVVATGLGLALSVVAVGETRAHAEAAGTPPPQPAGWVSTPTIVRAATYADPVLSTVAQAGLVNNLNDGMAWGLFPLLFARAGFDLATIGMLSALYPAIWALTQPLTGAASDVVGRKVLIAAGMVVQALGLATVGNAEHLNGFVAGQVLLGLGTAMVYPTLLAAVADVTPPSWRARAVGVVRFWRDTGYALGAVVAGLVADAFGAPAAVWGVAGLTAASGLLVWVRMPTPPQPPPTRLERERPAGEPAGLRDRGSRI